MKIVEASHLNFRINFVFTGSKGSLLKQKSFYTNYLSVETFIKLFNILYFEGTSNFVHLPQIGRLASAKLHWPFSIHVSEIMDSLIIDGSESEGGGQILRTALSLSSILQKPFIITNIRAKRPKSGLQPQHLQAVNALANITNADVTGAKLGSTEVEFSPRKITGGYYSFDIGTAGSISLLLQSLIPVLLFADRPSKITITGGTHVSHSPTMDYINFVFLPMIRKFDANCEIIIEELGWYPKGNGKVVLFVKPSSLKAVSIIKKENLISVNGCVSQSNLPEDIIKREEESIRSVFPGILFNSVLKLSASAGNSITLWAEYENTILGVDALGQKGLKAEKLALDAARELEKNIKSRAAVDKWMGDQLLIYMALADGVSQIKAPKITGHIDACFGLIPKFTGNQFKIDDKIISVNGIKRVI